MQGNPEYEKLVKTPEHVSWLKVNEATAGGVDAKVGGELSKQTEPGQTKPGQTSLDLPTTVTGLPEAPPVRPPINQPNGRSVGQPPQQEGQFRHKGQPENVHYYAGSLTENDS